jgi:hypothetical protein
MGNILCLQRSPEDDSCLGSPPSTTGLICSTVARGYRRRRSLIGDYRFEAKFGDLDSEEIEFAPQASVNGKVYCKYPTNGRDALLNYLIVQGDTNRLR